MLYVSSRNHSDTYPATRVLRESRASDGGVYIPFRLKAFSADELRSLSEASFNQTTANILNYLFQAHLSETDLDLGIGRMPVRLNTVNQRIAVAECWHNSHWDFVGLKQHLQPLLYPGSESESESVWVEIGLRIAIMFGAYSELLRKNILKDYAVFDISVVSGNFSAPISALYARSMGLPIGNIICCCNENNGLWNLFHYGEFRTDSVAVQTLMPNADIALPDYLEALISQCCGQTEALHYMDCCRVGRMYIPEPEMLEKLRKGIQVSVISQNRMLQTIPNVFNTYGYLLSSHTALAYAGLLDYRVRTGENRYGLLMADTSPIADTTIITDALKLSCREITEHHKKK